MVNMILRKLIFTLIGKFAGGKTAKNVRMADKAARMARRLGR
jgi:hypothetical protein